METKAGDKNPCLTDWNKIETSYVWVNLNWSAADYVWKLLERAKMRLENF